MDLTLDEQTKNGVMKQPDSASRPTLTTPAGPDYFFPDEDVEVIVETLHQIKQTAVPEKWPEVA